MRNLGYVQRFGVGIPIAREEVRRNGNPPPVFRVEDTHVVVTVRRRPSIAQGRFWAESNRC
ncbi:MAG: hypothetical protein KIT09_13080 [Bryobacteraceae bacterium]|nr:hypothetical protein [Bryobacteraceae bacterium]